MDFIIGGFAYFQKGGMVMYFLLLCSIFAVSIGVERFLYLKRVDAGRQYGQDFYDAMTTNNIERAWELSDKNSQATLPRLIYGGLKLVATNDPHYQSYIEVQSTIALSQMRKRLYFLNVIVTMAPLLGLLGTIVGMIGAFNVFDVANGQAMAITGGVGEALIATAFGLIVAILSLVIHSYFTQWIDNIINDMELSFALLDEQKPLIIKAGVLKAGGDK